MTNYFLNQLEKGPVLDWYVSHNLEAFLERVGEHALSKGYKFDKKSGLFFRPASKEKILKKPRQTILNIIFPRPTDEHRHYDVGEKIKIVEGIGIFYYRGKETKVKSGDERFVGVGTTHAFSPNKRGSLEVEVECTGIFNPQEEICSTRFYECGRWIKLWR